MAGDRVSVGLSSVMFGAGYDIKVEKETAVQRVMWRREGQNKSGP